MGAPIAFMEQMEARTLKSNKQTAITIRTNNGEAEQISIPNSNNWLFRLIKRNLQAIFPKYRQPRKHGRIFNGANRLRGEKRRMPSIRQLHTAFTECSMKKTQSPASPICRTNYANSFTTIHASRVVIPIIKERAANTTRK